MWVNSKTAAAVLSIKFDTLRKKVLRASNDCKNFCVVEYQKLYFQKITGRGGASGKVLQIWIDDSVIANFESQNGVRVSQSGIIQGSKCADLHGIWGEIPQESQNLANLPPASFNNGSLNTGDYFETHGVSRNDKKNGSLNTGDCFVSCDTRNDNNSSLDSSPCVRKTQSDGKITQNDG